MSQLHRHSVAYMEASAPAQWILLGESATGPTSVGIHGAVDRRLHGTFVDSMFQGSLLYVNLTSSHTLVDPAVLLSQPCEPAKSYASLQQTSPHDPLETGLGSPYMPISGALSPAATSWTPTPYQRRVPIFPPLWSLRSVPRARVYFYRQSPLSLPSVAVLNDLAFKNSPPFKGCLILKALRRSSSPILQFLRMISFRRDHSCKLSGPKTFLAQSGTGTQGQHDPDWS